MPEQTLKEKLINKLKEIDDPAILEEVSNLFELQEQGAIYQTSGQQKKTIAAAKKQVEDKTTFTNEEADKDVDEWLNK